VFEFYVSTDVDPGVDAELEAEVVGGDDDCVVGHLLDADAVKEQRMADRVDHGESVDRDGEGAGALVRHVGTDRHQVRFVVGAIVYVDGVGAGDVRLEIGVATRSVADSQVDGVRKLQVQASERVQLKRTPTR